MPISFINLVILAVSFSIVSASFLKAQSPNIVLVLTDDQGWGATSVLMDEDVPESKSDFIKTPHLEKLANRGVIFSQGYAPHPNCSPSRYSILTGKSPALLQMSDIVDRHEGPFFEGNRITPPPHVNDIADEEITVAEWLNQHRPEYAAAHFGKWHINGGGPERHGFDASSGATGNREGGSDDPDPKRIFSITKSGNDWMEKQVKSGKPFYLQLSHYATHLAVFSKKSTLDETEARTPGERHNQAGHAAMSQDLDTGLGMTLSKIKELGIGDNTYVIYLGDNGSYPIPNPSNTNGPLHGWKATLWEGGIRVPFIVAGPGILPGRSREPVVGYDLFPTIADWLGIGSVPADQEGGSLANILSGQSNAKVNRANPFLVFHFPHYQLQKGGQPSTTLHQGDFKLVKFWETGDYHLYNLKEDLSETRNLAKVDTNTTVRMSQLLEDYLKSIRAGIPTTNAQFDPQKDPGKKWADIKVRLVEDPYFIVP
ncbi:MAG: sulfatase [Opitutaceae bacterium]|nr:sulfatase [Opitutaceae bacterium]|tara:strand:- start:118 stop:1569 length:1452 start_codon:yes stop_codon:yes gene_type:complete